MAVFVIVKVVSPDVKAMLFAEGVASRVKPLMPSRTDKDPLIWVSLLISRYLEEVVTARTLEFVAEDDFLSLGLVKYEAVIQVAINRAANDTSIAETRNLVRNFEDFWEEILKGSISGIS